MSIKQLLAAFSLFALTASQSVNALVIDLHSGNGIVGGTDSEITFLAGPPNSGFTSAFTAAEFNSASTGSAAQIIRPHNAWRTTTQFSAAGGNSSALWISDKSTGAGEGSTVLYAIDFNNPFAAVSNAVMDFYWSVDNTLGNTTNAAVFINGMALSGIGGGGFGATYSSLNLDISPLLVSGNNTIYINSIDLGGPAGLIFSARLDLTEDTSQQQNGTVPAPAPIALLGLGLAVIGYTRRRISAA